MGDGILSFPDNILAGLSLRWRRCPIPAQRLVHADKHDCLCGEMYVFSVGRYNVTATGKRANGQAFDWPAKIPRRRGIRSNGIGIFAISA
jgi:hypothetical protein